MDLTGKIISVLPEKSGTSARGPWRKQEYVVEIPGDYPKQVCFMVWGDKIDQFKVTDVKAWRIERPDAQGNGPDAPPPPDEAPPPVFDDDIPF